MLYLHYDTITTALLPYFLTLVYLSIACWVRSEISDSDALSQPHTLVIYPEQVFQLLETPSPQPTVKAANKRTGTGKTKPKTTNRAAA